MCARQSGASSSARRIGQRKCRKGEPVSAEYSARSLSSCWCRASRRVMRIICVQLQLGSAAESSLLLPRRVAPGAGGSGVGELVAAEALGSADVAEATVGSPASRIERCPTLPLVQDRNHLEIPNAERAIVHRIGKAPQEYAPEAGVDDGERVWMSGDQGFNVL